MRNGNLVKIDHLHNLQVTGVLGYVCISTYVCTYIHMYVLYAYIICNIRMYMHTCMTRCSTSIHRVYSYPAQGYHILSVEGPLRESLSLLTSLPLGCRAAKEWLAGLDRAIRVSLSSLLTQCVDDYPKEMRFTSEAVHTQSATGWYLVF